MLTTILGYIRFLTEFFPAGARSAPAGPKIVLVLLSILLALGPKQS